MSKAINIRLSEEMQKKLNKTIKELQTRTLPGAEVNNSTIIRAALEYFFLEMEDNQLQEEGQLIKFRFDINKYSHKELVKAEDFLEKITEKIVDDYIHIQHRDAEVDILRILMEIRLMLCKKQQMDNFNNSINVRS